LIEDEKPHDHCLNIITAMADQELAEGAHFREYRGDYFAILDQLDFRELAFHSASCVSALSAGPTSLPTSLSGLTLPPDRTRSLGQVPAGLNRLKNYS
jgi:hypothetical protein